MTSHIQPVTELAQAVATQAVTAEHGDNDPRATLALEVRFGIGGYVDQQVPRLPDPPADRALCASWGRPPGDPS